jgi:hypothetical protein
MHLMVMNKAARSLRQKAVELVLLLCFLPMQAQETDSQKCDFQRAIDILFFNIS